MSASSLPPSGLYSGDTRSRVIAATAELIAAGGSEAATTRAVAAAASVQAPVIYRLFGDKEGLLDAAAEHILAQYVADKAHKKPTADPVEDLRQSWDLHVAFGLKYPAVFAVMQTAPLKSSSKALEIGMAVFQEKVHRVARAGRLRVSEARAVDLLFAMGTGTILAMLRKSSDEREGLSEAACDAAFAAVIGEQRQPIDAGAQGAASTLQACLDDVTALTPGERTLLGEWLKRIAESR